jgi:uncharacterized protein (TIGR00369 family)
MNPDFQTKDPAYADRVRASFYGQPFMRLIGAAVTSVTPGHCEIRLDFKPELTQQIGYFHAGVLGTLADNAGGYAALSLTPAGQEVLTVEYKINFMAPGRGEALVARAKVLKAGRTLIVCQSDVFNIQDGRELLAATAMLTMMPITAPRSSAGP